jgi:cardiolipin synthase A/B
MPLDLPSWWPTLVGTAAIVASALASVHVVLRKRDTRAAIGWVGLVWLVPGVGALLYALLGINRIRRKAISLHRKVRAFTVQQALEAATQEDAVPPVGIDSALAPLARLTGTVSGRPLTTGNRVDPLVDGDEAYPAMLAAIDGAQASIAICSYIFDNDRVGQRFVEALGRAVGRGVQVRVLLDGVGVRYSFPPIDRVLRRAGVRVARFLPTIAPTNVAFFNLRNHRKVLVVDGRLAFSGGMNIRAGHVLGDEPGHPVRDLHFRFEGPIVRQLQDAFTEDWIFTTKELLHGECWYPPPTPSGETAARVITDGPDVDFEALRTVIMGALASARRSVRIMTPYFLPDTGMIGALAVAALRGVRVDVVIPSRSNIAVVQWASMAQMWQVLEPGCHVHLSPPPFDHTKIMLVDETWAMVGSTNWDPRSLRLNFELNVECYDTTLASALDRIVQSRIDESQPLTLQTLSRRPFPTKLRDGVARLFSPYL